MSKKLILFLMVLLFGSANFLRADEVTIGDLGTAVSDTYLPMNSLYNYSYTQQIYTAEEIGTSGTINAITVWMYGNENLYEMPFNIYMMEVDKDEFDSSTDWVVVAESDMVYTGSVLVHNTEAEAYTFELDVPFEYSGTSNLLIAFNNTTGQWKGGLNAMVFGTTEDPARGIYARRDSEAYDPYDPTFTATSMTYRRNVITLDMAGGGSTTNTLTVFDGTDTKRTVPYNSYQATEMVKSQIIYPASALAPMAGKNITSMKFYVYSHEDWEYDFAWNCYVMETEETVFGEEFLDETAGTLVYTGVIDVTADEPEFVFNQPFAYNGGNLFVCFKNLNVADEYNEVKFYGVNQETSTGAWGQWDYFEEDYDFNNVSFLPKATFAYQGGAPTPPVPPAPEEWNPDTTVELTTLELLSPEHMAQNVENPVVLTWDTDLNAVEYKVEFGTTYPPATVVDWDTITVNNVNYYIAGDLDVNTRYFWRVSIRNSTNTLVSPLYNFVTKMNVPTNVELTATEIFEGETTTVKWKGNSGGGGGGGFTGELTVADGTTTNSGVPVYGLWMDDYTRSETIYPAEMLEEMNGGEITALRYYISSSASGPWTGNVFNVYMMEVDATTLASYYTSANAQIVYTGGLDGQGTDMYIELTTPYIYNGGNLLIGIEETTVGTWKSCSFFGIESPAASAHGYSASSLAAVTFNSDNFIPKTTFTCGGKKEGNRSLVGFNVYVNDVKVNDEVIVGSNYEIAGLEYNMEGYNVNVTAVYNEGESEYNEGENVVYVSGTGILAGTVKEILSYAPIADATVLFNGADEFGNVVTYQTTTDANGAFVIENVVTGEYTVGKASHEGYENNFMEEAVTVAYEEATEVNFILHEIYYPVAGVVAEDYDALAMVKWSMGDINVPTPGPTPGPGGGGSSLSEGFENGMPSGWNVIDANNDGWTWCLTSAIPTTWTYYASMSLDWYRTGTNAICSGSYINGVGALTPDEYLVTPQMTIGNGTTFSFWAAATDAGYPADHFGVFVSDNGTSNWTSVQEWTLTAKEGAANGGRASRDGNGAKLGTWYNYSVDLSAYAGSKYIAIRHFNCNDQYIMCVDDIEMSAKKGTRELSYFTLYKKTVLKQNMTAQDSAIIADEMTDTIYADLSWASTVPGLYQYGVSVVYPAAIINKGEERGQIVYNFEDGQIPSEFNNTISTYPWAVVDGNGGKVIKSSNGGVASSTSAIELAYTYPAAGTFSFDALCQGEGTSTIWDKCQFFIDGAEQFCYGANMPGWNNYNYEIEAGDHTFKWSYTKDGSVNPTGDCFQVDNITIEYEGAGETNDDPITPIVWSNVLPKNMETSVAVHATVNTGSVVGATLTMTNAYSNSIAYTATFDETGIVEFEEFFKGDYYVTVALEGYNSTYAGELVSIWDETTLNVLLSENKAPVDELLVSNTGFARWTNLLPTPDVALSYKVKLNNSVVAQNLTDNYYQFENLTVGTTYTAAVAVVYTTGMSAYVETEFTYLGCESVETQVEELAGTVQGMNIMLTWNGGQPTPPGPNPPTPPVGGDTYDFEDGTMMGWTNIDADGDDNVWAMGTDAGHNSTGYVTSESYINYVGALTPDNYLVSPGAIAAQAGAAITFWAGAQDAAYPSEHFGVAVSTTGNTSASDFTTIQEWTMTAKAPAAKRERGMNTQGAWYQYTVDLSSYAGQNIYVAIRHFDCTDWFRLNVDDITLSDGSEKSIAAAGYGFGATNFNGTRDWYYYDNGNNDDAIGLTSGGGFYWGIMFPAGTYEGNKVTKVAYFDYAAHNGTVSIYQGGASAPGTLLHTQNYTVTGSSQYIEFDMEEPVEIDNTQNLWVVMHNNNGQYVAAIDNSAGVTYGSCISTDGSTWYTTVSAASGGQLDGNWNLRVYTEAGGSTTTALTPNKYNIFIDGEIYGATATNSFTIVATDTEEHVYTVVYIDANYNISCAEEVTLAAGQVCDPVTGLTAAQVVYQGAAAISAEWNAMEGAVGYKVALDGEILGQITGNSVTIHNNGTPLPAGTYSIGVIAVYANCESDMVEVSVTLNDDNVDENAIVSAIYPNPVNSDLHINATAMTHVSVFNAMGQMVYDQAVSGDEMVINMGQYEAGVYMVRIDTENGSSVKRITVVK